MPSMIPARSAVLRVANSLSHPTIRSSRSTPSSPSNFPAITSTTPRAFSTYPPLLSASTLPPNPRSLTEEQAASMTPEQLAAFQESEGFNVLKAEHEEHGHGEGGGHGHESHYDPPSGWLWGIKPGEKVEKEGWENVWIWGFFGSIGAAVVAWGFKPDTSIQTWALEEARRRLEVEGILKEPETKS